MSWMVKSIKYYTITWRRLKTAYKHTILFTNITPHYEKQSTILGKHIKMMIYLLTKTETSIC